MNENYSEYSVKVSGGAAWAGLSVSVLAAAAGLYLAMSVHVLCILLAAAGAAGIYIGYLHLQLEYETIYLDGTVEVSAIYHKMKRKRKCQFEMKDVSGYFLGKKKDAVRLGRIQKDFSSGDEDALCCVVKVEQPGGAEVVCLEPGEEMASILRQRYRQLEVS